MRVISRVLELEGQERDMTRDLSLILEEIEAKLGQFERGEIVTTDLCGKELKYQRPSHKHTKISNQLGDHATRFVTSVSF